MGEEGAEEHVFLTDEAEHIVLAADAISPDGSENLSVLHKCRLLVAVRNLDGVERDEEGFGFLNGILEVFVTMEGRRLFLNLQHVFVTVTPCLCKSEHLRAHRVVDGYEVASIGMRLGEG